MAPRQRGWWTSGVGTSSRLLSCCTCAAALTRRQDQTDLLGDKRIAIGDELGGGFNSTANASGMYWGYRVSVSAEDQASGPPQIMSPSVMPYNLTAGTRQRTYSQLEQDIRLAPVLSEIKHGFFVESGAYDGETDSNTLRLELQGWTGLLVEPHPVSFAKLEAKHRRAWAFQGCLSTSRVSETLRFESVEAFNEASYVASNGHLRVAAEPLMTLLGVLNRSTVDFWSLDVEGSECFVLEAVDFHQVEIGVILVEMNKNRANSDCVRSILLKAGFHDIGSVRYQDWGQWWDLDTVFVNAAYFEARKLRVPTHLGG